MPILNSLRAVSRVRRGWPHVKTYWRALRDPRTPTWAKVALAAAAGYAVMPIDLVPDVVPLAGILDDLVVVPLLLSMAIKAIPDEVLRDVRAEEERKSKAR